jgi:hypothetical protein
MGTTVLSPQYFLAALVKQLAWAWFVTTTITKENSVTRMSPIHHHLITIRHLQKRNLQTGSDAHLPVSSVGTLNSFSEGEFAGA